MVKHTSMFAGGLGLLICALTSPADAVVQVMSGYGAFRPTPSYGSSSQGCVTHLGGGALNQCGSTLGMVIFDLPIAEATVQTAYSITARSFGSSSSSFQCRAVALNPTSTIASEGTLVSFAATSAIDTKSFGVNVPAGWSLRLRCNNVPNNKGILNIRWTPVAES